MKARHVADWRDTMSVNTLPEVIIKTWQNRCIKKLEAAAILSLYGIV